MFTLILKWTHVLLIGLFIISSSGSTFHIVHTHFKMNSTHMICKACYESSLLSMIYWVGTRYCIVHTYFKMNSSHMLNKKSYLKIGEWCWFTKEKTCSHSADSSHHWKLPNKSWNGRKTTCIINMILSGLSENFDRIMVTDNGTDNPDNGYRLLSGYHSLVRERESWTKSNHCLEGCEISQELFR